MGRFGKKKKDSDEEDEGEEDAPKAEEEKKPEEEGAGTGGKLQRNRARGKTRFGAKAAGSDDEAEEEEDKDEAEKRKAKQEERKKMIAEAKQKKEKEEIEQAEEEEAGELEQEEELGGMASAIKRKDSKAKTRFEKASDEQSKETEAERGSSAIVSRRPDAIPWVPTKRRVEEEKSVLFRVGGREEKKSLNKARNLMQEQGLYVAREQVMLPSNVERAIQRVRRAKKAAEEQAKLLGRDTEKEEGDNLRVKEGQLDEKSGLVFEADEEPFLLPFDPLKDRLCRPAMRYDPSLPYMQQRVQVPTSDMSAVFGTSDSRVRLELEIKELRILDHPLFSTEDYMAAELGQLWTKYKRRADINWVDFYSQKLEAALSALETINKERHLVKDEGKNPRKQDKGVKKDKLDPVIGHGGAIDKLLQEQYLHEEIRHLRLQRAHEEFEDLAIVSRMIDVWGKLKQLRITQKFQSTKVDLKFRQKRTNQQQDDENWKSEMQAELDEMKKMHESEFRMKEAKYIADKKALENKVKVLTDKIEELDEKLLQAQDDGPGDEDDDDDDDDDEEEEEESSFIGAPSPKKKKKKKTAKSSDGKMATQLLFEKQSETDTLAKLKELLEKLETKQPKETDDAFKFDEAKARDEIVERQKRTKREPGSPIYIPVYSNDKLRTEVVPDSKEGKEEKARRAKVKKLQLFLRVSVNGEPLRGADGGKMEIPLQQRPGHDWVFQVNETIQLEPTTGLPRIQLHLCKQELVSSEVATVFVPVGEDSIDESEDMLTFQSEEPFKLRPGVEPLTQHNIEEQQEYAVRPAEDRFIGGDIQIRLSHMVSALMAPEDGQVVINMDAGTGLDSGANSSKKKDEKGGIVSASKLKRMINTNQLDPNDPRHQHLLELMSRSKEQEGEKSVNFDTLYDGITIGEKIQLSTKEKTVIGNRWVGFQNLTCPAGMRHKMLMAREKNPGAFTGGLWPENVIPLFDNEIEDDDNRRDEFFDKVYAVEFPEVDEEARQRTENNKKVKKLLEFRHKVQEQVRKAKAKQGQKSRRVYRLEDVVHQPELPEFGAPDIIAAIQHFFRKRSALRPQEKVVKPSMAAPASCKISITVQRAHNLPHRRIDSKDGGASVAESKRPQLECIVEARFDKAHAKTPVFKGNHPAWNSHLQLPFEPPAGNWSPSNLMKISEDLHLNVFDTKVWTRPDGDGQTKKLEKRWLGSVRFPFTTLYQASSTGRIEGVFELDAPPHIVGYTHATKAAGTGKSGESKKLTDEDYRCSLQVCVALDPPLALPQSRDNEVKVRLHGQAPLDQRIREWISQCKAPNHCKDRTFDALGRSLTRDWVLATRFVTPQAPPPIYDQTKSIDVQMHQLCRFVSLIPFLEDFQLEDSGGDDIDQESMDVWCTSTEFLDIMAGDWEEHATLLCNFFLQLNRKAFVVFGNGIPEGDTVYCMTIDPPPKETPNADDTVWLWNASKGHKYKSTDTKCTLKEIYYAVGKNNIWGNIQVTKDLSKTSFNFEDKKAWRPLFNEKYKFEAYQTETVQTPIDWKLGAKKDEDYVKEVEKYISLAIRNRLEHWRSREGKSMVESPGAAKILGNVLRKMEQSSHKETSFTEEDLYTDLAKYLQPGSASGFDITGFYINRPFTDVQPIIDEIENADIHHAGPVTTDGSEKDVQFAHAVYVKAFPRRVLSLWVAVACLYRKRGT